MQTTLIGYTGFVGSNLYNKHKFDNIYNSKNITEAFDKTHDLVIYSGIRAEKYLANTNPEADKQVILNAIENIKKLNPKKLVLISTVDVYKTPDNVDENTIIDTENLHPYGYNRYLLEQWVQENINDYLIIRLPGLYGMGIKKNFLYDMFTIIPFMLTHEKYSALNSQNSIIEKNYEILNDKFYKLADIPLQQKDELKEFFINNDFNALSFTDSRSSFQFYNLGNLWNDINTALNNNIKLLNLNSQSVTAGDIYKYINNKNFNNITANSPVYYDIKTIHSNVFNGTNGYIKTKDEILKDIALHIKTEFKNV